MKIKRVYEKPRPSDGKRILVDRLWPRGLSKENAKVDYWRKEIAPSDKLRKWFGHKKERWEESRRRYFEELKNRNNLVKQLKNLSKTEVLLYCMLLKIARTTMHRCYWNFLRNNELDMSSSNR